MIDIEELGDLCRTCPKQHAGCQDACPEVPLKNGTKWYRPFTVNHATELLTSLAPNVRVISGDTARHVEKYYAKKNQSNYANIIDLSRCTELTAVTTHSGL